MFPCGAISLCSPTTRSHEFVRAGSVRNASGRRSKRRRRRVAAAVPPWPHPLPLRQLLLLPQKHRAFGDVVVLPSSRATPELLQPKSTRSKSPCPNLAKSSTRRRTSRSRRFRLRRRSRHMSRRSRPSTSLSQRLRPHRLSEQHRHRRRVHLRRGSERRPRSNHQRQHVHRRLRRAPPELARTVRVRDR